ncbi:MAG: ankyrin repeat domain-containing protein [Candidatus Brocadiia bacterium]
MAVFVCFVSVWAAVGLLAPLHVVEAAREQESPKQQKLNERLFVAIWKRNAQQVRDILQEGADPNAVDGMWGGNPNLWMRTALIEAARLGEAEIVRLLLDSGADPTKCQPMSGFGPINAALKSYEAETAEIIEMLEDEGVDLSAPPPNPVSQLSKWREKRWRESVDERLRTLLHTAAVPGRNARRHDPMAAARKTEMLIEAGLPLNNRNNLDQTALILLVAEGRYQGRQSQLNVLEELLSHGPDLDAQDVDGCTALHHAVIQMDPVVAEMLLEAGARNNLQDEKGRTPPELARDVYPRADVLEVLGLEVPPMPDGGIRAHIHPSRTRGVAPLGVFFDGVGTDGLAEDDYLNAYYDWDFDVTGVDPDHPRKTGIGFNTAHVFRKPGTYTVRMRVKDTEGKQGETTVTINVLPFGGKTFYVAADGDDANPGTIQNPWKSFDHALTHARPNTRILFRRGDEFRTEGVGLAEKEGPVIVGAYTGPERPSESAPLIVGKGIASMRDVRDWRFMDLDLRGLTTERRARNSGKAFALWGVRDILLQNLEIENFGANGVTDPGRSHNSDGIFVADCHMHDFGAYGMYSSRGTRIGFLGNHLQRMHSNEHGYRSQSADKSYIAHNNFGEDLGAVKTAIQVRGDTKQAVIARNRLGRTASFAIANNNTLAFVHHCLAEGNIMTAGFTLGAQEVTLRNNRMKYGLVVGPDGKKRKVGAPMLAGFDAHMNWGGVCEDIRICDNAYRGPLLLRSPVNNLSVHNNIVVIARDSFRGVFGVPRADEEVKSDANVYYALNAETGEALDISEWLAGRRNGGNDRNSKVVNPQFMSLDPDSPDFLLPAPDGPAAGVGAEAVTQ